jgi:hypothetical protein
MGCNACCKNACVVLGQHHPRGGAGVTLSLSFNTRDDRACPYWDASCAMMRPSLLTGLTTR